MAIYTLPEGSPRKKGSRGGSTFTKTCNGFIIRRRFKSKNRKTIRQSECRSSFMEASKNWHLLNDAEKQSYFFQKNGYPKVDSLGVTYYLGRNVLQNSLSQIKLLNSGTKMQTCPPATAVVSPSFVGGGAVANPPFLSFSFDMNTTSTDYAIRIFITKAGNYSFPLDNYQGFKFVLDQNIFFPTTIDLIPYYISLFGSINWKVGDQVAIKIENLSRYNSCLSPAVYMILQFS